MRKIKNYLKSLKISNDELSALDNATSEIQNQLNLKADALGYKELVALITFNTGENQSISVIKNTIGGTPYCFNTDNGDWECKLFLLGMFTADKTVSSVYVYYDSVNPDFSIIKGYRVDDNYYNFTSFNYDGTSHYPLADGTKLLVEIRVYD